MMRVVAAGLLALAASHHAVEAQEIRRFSLATTPAIERTGVLNALVLAFQTETGTRVQLVPANDANAFEMGRQGGVDAMLVTDLVATERFVSDGLGVDARGAFYTDFMLAGPADDPAGVQGLRNITEAFRRVAAARAPFVSRGDDSASHQREVRIWREAGIEPPATEQGWYRRLGKGARPTLETAVADSAYLLVSRLTWARFTLPHRLRILAEGDTRLRAMVHSVVVNPARFEFVRGEDAKQWSGWLISPAGQAAVASFRIEGHTVFFPIATWPEALGVALPPMSWSIHPWDAPELRWP
jgi:tungstate transport system substrate-binding protein